MIHATANTALTVPISNAFTTESLIQMPTSTLPAFERPLKILFNTFSIIKIGGQGVALF